MIRTRDFLLYVLALGFVLLGVVYTGFSSRVVAEVERVLLPATAEAPAYGAYAPTSEQNVAARWQELRSKLAAGEGYIASAPPDFTSVDQRALAAQVADATSSQATLTGERAVQWCNAPIPALLTSRWPNDTRLVVTEGQRIVETVRTNTVQTGSTTETLTSTETLLALPVRTVRTPFDSCLPDTLIGVTAAGQPLTNDQAELFTNVAPNQAIGYTRDGFAVYGPLPDSSDLDACGGRYVGGVYRYHIRVNEPFIISCYAGVPVAL